MTTPRAPRPKTSKSTVVTRAEFEALSRVVSGISKQLSDDKAMRVDTHAMVSGLHHALIEPGPGHLNGLLHRMASVTIAAETGQAAGEKIIWWAKVLGAGGIILSSFWAAIRFGHYPKG